MKMADEVKQEKPESIWRRLSSMEWIAIGLLVGFIFYLHNATGIVVNFNDTNQTRVINGVQNLPNTVIYSPNSFVPKSSVNNTHVFIGVLIVIIAVALLLAKKLIKIKRATMPEAMRDIDKNIRQLKTITLSDGRTLPITPRTDIKITPQFMTRYRFIGQNMEKPEFRYTFLVRVIDELEEISYMFKAWYHPWTRYWDGFYETAMPLSDKDRCIYCGGTEYDVKYILSDELMKFRELRRGMGITR